MISVSEASSIINSRLFKPLVTEVPLEGAAGHVLAEVCKADRDLPPFDRVTMDGIAIAFDSFRQGQRTFQLAGVQAAGQPALTLPSYDHAIEVMTGAMLPYGTDTVIRYEDLEIKNNVASILISSIEDRQNIHPQAQDARQQDVLLSPGMPLSPAETALLASIGKSSIKVYALPQTAIISTGDELVPVDTQPRPWQIRRSNGYAIQAALKEMNHPATLFHVSDDESTLKTELKKIFESHSLIILSGGVSKGKFDFIPAVMEELGIQKLFHQVSQKPGKPFWFGRSAKHTVFALPGNPVSTYLCFYRYIKPWLLKSCGIEPATSKAILAKDFSFKPALTYFLQVKIKNEDGKVMAYPDAGGGSGDFANLKQVDGFVELPMDKTEFKAGEVFPYFSFRN